MKDAGVTTMNEYLLPIPTFLRVTASLSTTSSEQILRRSVFCNFNEHEDIMAFQNNRLDDKDVFQEDKRQLIIFAV